MSCSEIEHFLDPLLDNELPVEESARILHHLDNCVSCQETWQQLSSLRSSVHDATNSIDVPKSLQKKLSKSCRVNSGKKNLYVIGSLSAVAASLIGYFIISAPPPLSSNEIVVEEMARRRSILGLLDKDAKPPIAIEGWSLIGSDHFYFHANKASRYNFIKNGNDAQTISFYQLEKGKFNAKGMTEHEIDGKKICCGERDNSSLVYYQSPKFDNVLISSLPMNKLMTLAIKTRLQS